MLGRLLPISLLRSFSPLNSSAMSTKYPLADYPCQDDKKPQHHLSTNRQQVELIVACDEKNGIGKNGKIPWHFPKEMEHFKKTTTACSPHWTSEKRNVVIMGKNTWFSIPGKFLPLRDRINVVVSKKAFDAQQANSNALLQIFGDIQPHFVFPKLTDALQFARTNMFGDRIIIMGGAQIYKEALERDLVDVIHLTRIANTYDCDCFFPFDEHKQKFLAVKTRDTPRQVEEKGVHYQVSYLQRQR